ncbi:MAG: Hpt domain-containing protein [Nitrospirae bacterium]|nr:Hpt domain-containing protein [Candidatus Manganitrophaceae bacterium]
MQTQNSHNLIDDSGKKGEEQRTNAIDMDILSDLREVMEEGFSKLLGLFLNSVPEQIVSLAECAAQNDAENIAKIAHSLKSSAANLGALVLSAHCKDLETAARSGEIADCLKKIKGLELEFLCVKKELEIASKKSSPD